MVPDIRLRRTELSLRAEDLAAELGVHTTSIHRWERRARLPGPVHIVGIARALDLPTSDVASFFDEARPAAGEPAPGVRGPGLRAIRTVAKVRASQIAETVGVPTAHVYNWESGTDPPTASQCPGRPLPTRAGATSPAADPPRSPAASPGSAAGQSRAQEHAAARRPVAGEGFAPHRRLTPLHRAVGAWCGRASAPRPSQARGSVRRCRLRGRRSCRGGSTPAARPPGMGGRRSAGGAPRAPGVDRDDPA